MGFTPVAKQLQQRLEDRRAWFHNWLFQWHRLKEPNGLVEVDLFNGRTSHMGGIEFCGSARDVYWDAITRGTRKEILEQLAWVDEQVRRYNPETALESIDQAAGLLVSFARGVRRDAIEKDRILRGNGITFPPKNDAGFWHGTSEQEIRDYAESLKRALPVETSQVSSAAEAAPQGVIHRLNEFTDSNRWWIGAIGAASAVVTLLAVFG